MWFLQSGKYEVLMAVDQFPDGVQMSGVTRGLTEHRKDGLAKVPHGQVLEDLGGPPRWLSLKLRTVDHCVSSSDLLAIGVEYSRGRGGYRDPPCLVARAEVHRLTGYHGAEPEPLYIESEVLNQPEATPTRRQHRLPQSII